MAPPSLPPGVGDAGMASLASLFPRHPVYLGGPRPPLARHRPRGHHLRDPGAASPEVQTEGGRPLLRRAGVWGGCLCCFPAGLVFFPVYGLMCGGFVLFTSFAYLLLGSGIFSSFFLRKVARPPNWAGRGKDFPFLHKLCFDSTRTQMV